MHRGGSRLAAFGGAIDQTFAWSVVQAMNATQQTLTIEEEEAVFVARATDAGRVLIAAFSLQDVSLGLARALFNSCCARAA